MLQLEFWLYALRNPAVRERVAAPYRQYRTRLAPPATRYATAGPEPEEVVAAAIALYHSLTLQWQGDPRPFGPDLVTRILHALDRRQRGAMTATDRFPDRASGGTGAGSRQASTGDDASARWGSLMFPADVLIIGGGIQGLVLLDDLTRHGYACVLVTNADLGSGQTLHSHGLLNSGTALLTGQLRDPLRTALSFARQRGLQLYGEDSWYVLVPPATFQQLRAGWDESNYEYRELFPADLPPGFRGGDLFRKRIPTHIIGLKGYNFPKRQLVRLLSETQTQRVIRGDIAAVHRSVEQGAIRIDSIDIRLQATGGVVAISPQVVIAAAGTGTKRLLKSIVAYPSGQLARVTYTRTHMICIRSPHGVLPATSIMSLPHGLISVAHENHDHDRVGHDAGDSVTWYVTPAEDAVHHEDAPDSARAEVSGEIVTRGMHNLLNLYPALKREADGAWSQIRFGVFAGYKQNVGDQPTLPACDPVDGTRNVFIALPSVLMNAWTNAQTVLRMLDSRVPPGGPSIAVPGARLGVRVGAANELTDEVTWMPWAEFVRAFPGIF